MCDIENSLLEQFNTYSSNYSDEPEDIRMKLTILNSARAVVESYLGYSLEQKEYVEDYCGSGTRVLYLHYQPIQEVFNVQINGVELDPLSYEVCGDNIRFAKYDRTVFPKDAVVTVDYIAGYGKRLPDIVVQTILRIATLMLTEANGNIGISGKSDGDNFSRTYISYTNYQKYLLPLIKLRSFEL